MEKGLRNDVRLLASFLIVAVMVAMWAVQELDPMMEPSSLLTMFVTLVMGAASVTLFGTGRINEATEVIRRLQAPRDGSDSPRDDDNE